MFERFSDRARRVLVSAQDEARRLGHDLVGSEHILLALVSAAEGVAARALMELKVDLEDLRQRVEASTGTAAPAQPDSAPPFTPEAKRCLESALREALGLGHDYIDTEHLLLALVGQRVAGGVLTSLGVSREAVVEQAAALRASGEMDRPTPGEEG